jgi:hypothetical protein
VALGGYDAYETSLNIAKKMVELGANPTQLFVAGGWATPADALSAASVAAANGAPILAIPKTGLTDAQKAFVATLTGVTKSYVVGGTAVIDAAVEATLPGTVTRLAGLTQYDTNLKVLQNFTDLNYSKVFVANGKTFVDALAGAPLAAKYGAPIVLADQTVDSALATYVKGQMTSASNVVALGGTAAVPETVRVAIETGVVTPVEGALSVTSVSAISANSIKVVFNQAPADTSKVTFAVTRSTTPVVTTVTWNSAKTEATLTGATNFPEGSYAIAVKNDTTELGTSTVAISQQKVGKINITSTKLAVNNNIGYATYQVLDQYGNDITISYLANNINFQSGVGTVTKKNGLLTITPTGATNLIQFSSIVITGFDSTSGVSVNATLTTSTALGTLSNIELNSLTNADNKELTAGDIASTWYIDYTATDISGNKTKDYNFIKNGVINGALTCSNNDVIVAIAEDPLDSTKAVIKVTVSANSIVTDMPVSITAMTYAGTTSTLNVTLKKASTLDTFTLMAPSFDIASGETKTIPFVAYDQNGKQLTKYTDITGLTLSNDLTLVKNVDGTAGLQVKAIANPGTSSISQTVTASTSTGKLSTLTLNIQPAKKADTLSLDATKVISAMQARINTYNPDGSISVPGGVQLGASQTFDFGYDETAIGGLSVKDQYGRAFDMLSAPGNYQVVAVANGNVSVTGSAAGASGIKIEATDAGTATVTFKLVDKTEVYPAGHTSAGNVITAPADFTAIDSKTVTFSIIDATDIKDYTIDTVPDAIYTAAAVNGAYTARDAGYGATPKVYGKTASGAKVVLGGTPVIGISSTSEEFVVDGFTPGSPVAYDKVKLVALKYADTTKTEASTTLTVTLMGADGAIHTVTTPVKSSKSSPVANNVDVYVDTTIAGVSKNNAGDTVTIDETNNPGALNALGLTAGKYVARYDANGVDTGRANINFFAEDQYGSKAMQLANILVVPSETRVADSTFAIAADGTITGALAANDYVTISAVTTNGLVKTLKIVVE